MILDRGDAASVAVVCCPCVPFVGMRFVYSGAVWEVTHAKDHLRGWVARPAPRANGPMTAWPVVSGTRCIREI